MVTDGGEDIRYQEEQKTIKKIHEERERKRESVWERVRERKIKIDRKAGRRYT